MHSMMHDNQDTQRVSRHREAILEGYTSQYLIFNWAYKLTPALFRKLQCMLHCDFGILLLKSWNEREDRLWTFDPGRPKIWKMVVYPFEDWDWALPRPSPLATTQSAYPSLLNGQSGRPSIHFRRAGIQVAAHLADKDAVGVRIGCSTRWSIHTVRVCA